MRLSAMTTTERDRLTPHVMKRWDDLIALFQSFGITSSTIIGSDTDRQIVVWLMEDKDIIVDDSRTVISEETLSRRAEAYDLDVEILRQWYINWHILKLPPKNASQ